MHDIKIFFKMKKILAILFLAFKAFSQDELVVELPYEPQNIDLKKNFLILKNYNKISFFDITYKKHIDYNGIEYISSIADKHILKKIYSNTLIFLDSSYNKSDSITFSYFLDKSYFYKDTALYFLVKNYDYYEVWVTKGTKESTRKIIARNGQIYDLTINDNKLFFFEKSNENQNLCTFDFINQTRIIKSFDADSFNLSNLQFYKNKLFYNVFHKQKFNIYKTTLNDFKSEIFLENANGNLKFMPDGNIFIISYNIFKVDTLSKSVKRLTNTLTAKNSYVDYHFSDSVFTFHSEKTGVEICKLSGDSLKIFDIATGHASGIDLLLSYGEFKNLFVKNDTIYVVATNNGDKENYLYRLTNKKIESLFKVDYSMSLKLFDNQALYYTINEKDKFILYKKTDFSVKETQPLPTSIKYDSEEWTRNSGFVKLSLSNSHDKTITSFYCDIDTLGNVISASNLIGGYFTGLCLMETENTYKLNARGGYCVSKRDKFGKIIWNTTFSEFNGTYRYKSNFKVIKTKSGDIIVSLNSFGHFYINDDSIKSDTDRLIWVVFKLDGKTGKIKWKRKLKESSYSSDYELDAITIDNNDNILLSYLSDLPTSSIDGYSVSNNKYPFNALLKLDSLGKTIWLKKIETPWIKDYGKTKCLLNYSEMNQTVSIQSLVAYNTTASCQYKSRTLIQMTDQNGNRIYQDSIVSSDLGGVLHATIYNQKLIMTGYFRGTITASNFTATSPNGEDCTQNSSFISVFDLKKQKFDCLQASDTVFYPTNIKAKDNTIYILGGYPKITNRNSAKYLCINKYNLSGILLEKLLIDSTYNFRFNDGKIFDMSMALNKNHAVIQYQFNQDYEKRFEGTYLYGVDRTQKINLENGFKKVFFPKEEDTKNGIMIYPNPTQNNLFIYSFDAKIIEYSIFDSVGKKILSATPNDTNLEVVELSNFNTGIYFLSIKSEKNIFFTKFLKD
ncbi:MAG: T9SS C-terminal target domain-containing protein [Bacteroidetes bacterium]|nr:MAG: T9SS C-terminal target domain-containing protein [Bacteroidota bacterium]